MTDQTKRYAVTSSAGSVEGNRHHAFTDCPSIRGSFDFTEVTSREIELLGLKPCSRCEKRMAGGPALDTLTAILEVGPDFSDVNGQYDAEAEARHLLDELAKAGYYVAAKGQRKKAAAKKENTSA